MRLRMGTFAAAITLSLAVGAVPALAGSGAHAKRQKVFVVCKHGCPYRSIHAALDAVKRGNNSVIKIRPGTYKEGVAFSGHRYDGISFVGSSRNPRKTVLDGTHAKLNGDRHEQAQNGIDATNVNGVKIKNLWARDFQTNGFFVHADNGTTNCKGFLMKNDLASFNRSYGLFAKRCIGGRITDSVGWGHGDSAIYIGETPPQKNPKWTEIDHDVAYENVLGYSGTNSKYVDIHDSKFFNNGAGVAPNNLPSERFQPPANGRIRDNLIYWNNFNYFLPNSPVKTVSGGLGEFNGHPINYPTGVGVILFGTDGWVVKDNRIFGNFFWGASSFSNGLDNTGKQLSQRNRFIDNKMGRNGTDTNRFDFYSDGSGKGTCFEGNSSSTFDNQPGGAGAAALYPTCPAPQSSGTGTVLGDGPQFGELAGYVTSDPPCKQEDKWVEHSHPAFKGITTIDTKNFGSCSWRWRPSRRA